LRTKNILFIYGIFVSKRHRHFCEQKTYYLFMGYLWAKGIVIFANKKHTIYLWDICEQKASSFLRTKNILFIYGIFVSKRHRHFCEQKTYYLFMGYLWAKGIVIFGSEIFLISFKITMLVNYNKDSHIKRIL